MSTTRLLMNRSLHITLGLGLSLSLAACDKNTGETVNSDQPVPAEKEPTEPSADADAEKPVFTDLASVLASSHRGDNAARDAYRHPQETLEFFGLQPNMTVVELSPGGGWYTEILGPYLRDEGTLIVTNWPADHERYGKYAAKFVEKVEAAPDIFGDLQIVTAPLTAEQAFELAPEATVDLVVTFRNSHGWFNSGQTEQIYGAAFKALEPGGVFGVVQHRAAKGKKAKDTSKSGYLPEAQVIADAKAVGFELVESSEINANPNDTRDYPAGVWSLPPNLRGPEDGQEQSEEDKAKHTAIGESDRMTLKFKKPE